MDRREQYLAKLRDPRWQKKRLEIYQRDEFCCQRCFDSESMLAVHHRYYLGGRDPWDYPNAALVTLCQTCHEYETENLRTATADIVQMLRQAGAMSYEFEGLCNAVSSSGAIGDPRNEYDWSVIAFALRDLLARGEIYDEVEARYRDWCAEEAERRRKAKPEGGE